MAVHISNRDTSFPFGMTFLSAGAMNLITDVVRVATLGTNSDIDTATQPEDIWSGSDLGILNAVDHKVVQIPQTPATVEVVSDSINDTSAGTGLRTVLISYLDNTFNSKTTTITLNGTTPVAFPETIQAVNFMVRNTVGVYMGANIGNISLRVAGGAGVTYGYMQAGTGFFRTSAYTVPLGYSLMVNSIVFGINRTDTSDRWGRFSLPILTSSGGISKALELSVSTSVPYRHEADGSPLVVIPEKQTIWVTCEAVSANNTAVFGGFSGLIIKNTRLIVGN